MLNQDEIHLILTRAIDKAVYDTLHLLRFDGGEPQKISESPFGPVVYITRNQGKAIGIEIGITMKEISVGIGGF